MIRPEYMTMLQFISAAVGLGLPGINASTKMTMRNASEAMLMGNPQRPSLSLDGKSSRCVYRRQIMQPIETMQLDRSPVVAREVIEFNATGDPMLMSASKPETTKVVRMALTGTSHPAGTLENHVSKGTAWSRAKA